MQDILNFHLKNYQNKQKLILFKIYETQKLIQKFMPKNR